MYLLYVRDRRRVLRRLAGDIQVTRDAISRHARAE